MAQLKEIWIYPVKSCAGIRVEECFVEPYGLKYDRNWMLVDESGKFLSQRELPKMSQVKTAIEHDELILQVNDQRFSFSLPEEPQRKVQVQIWKSQLLAVQEEGLVSEALSDYLARKVRLVRFSRSEQRVGKKARFADSQPVLVIDQASLEELNWRSGFKHSMLQFRPNLVLEGGSPFWEDEVKSLCIGEQEFAFEALCARCSITAVNPETGEHLSNNPLTSLAAFRRKDGLKGVYFGAYFSPVHPYTTLSTGTICR